MTSVILVSTDKYVGREYALVLAPDLNFNESNGERQLLEVYRNVNIKPDHNEHRMHHLKEYSLNGDPSRMECDDGDTTHRGVDTTSDQTNYKRKPFDEENLANKKPNLSCLFDEDENFDVNIYIVYPSGNSEFDHKIAKTLIPMGVIVAPEPTDGSEDDKGNIITELTSNSERSTLLYVTTKDDITNCTSRKNRHRYELCPKHNLRNSVCKILQKCPQRCTDRSFENINSLFLQEDSLPRNKVNELAAKKMIVKVNSGKKQYICPKPEELIKSLEPFKYYRVEKRKITSAMNKGQGQILLDALVALNLILCGDRSDIYIIHLFSTSLLPGDNICSRSISPIHNALHITADQTFSKSEILLTCEILDWKITRALDERNTDENFDCFLLRKDDSPTVLIWFDNYSETDIYLCALDGNDLNERERDDLHSLRCRIKEVLGGSVKTSICVSYNGKSDVSSAYEAKAKDFIQDSVGAHCHWMESNDKKLFYKEDALVIFRIWISPSEECEIKRVLNGELDNCAIGKLCSLFQRNYELFFLEQEISGAKIDEIRNDFRFSSRQQITELIKAWQCSHENASLFHLRHAAAKSVHKTVSLVDFDKMVQDFLHDRPSVSLI